MRRVTLAVLHVGAGQPSSVDGKRILTAEIKAARNLLIGSKDDTADAFARIIRDRSDALIVFDNGPNFVNMTAILDFAAKHRVPVIFGDRG